jgi:mono/diheme cytochrome c family protein
MKKALKILGWGVAGVLIVVLFAALVIWLVTQSHWNTTYSLSSETVTISDDPQMLDHGRHVLTIRGCFDCHGENLGGKIFLEDPGVGRIVATNLTSGEGGIGRDYSDEDLVRSIRKGVRKDGKSVLFMPSHEYALLHQRDIDAMISYMRSMPPVDSQLPPSKLNLPIRTIYLLAGNVSLFPARLIDQTIPVPLTEPASVMEMGKYLSTTCIGCHGGNLSGGTIAGVPPHWPQASNLTPAGPMGSWSEADFFRAMKEGITPDGRHLENEYMPYSVLGAMTDEEMHALFVYLQSIEPFEKGVR